MMRLSDSMVTRGHIYAALVQCRAERANIQPESRTSQTNRKVFFKVRRWHPLAPRSGWHPQRWLAPLASQARM